MSTDVSAVPINYETNSCKTVDNTIFNEDIIQLSVPAQNVQL